ncbi:hypothetical protein FHS43_003723 [Streptosporangium becharense]|uniref:DUF2637 domain-containing protein n=1 Tax=Streptosporangium becharense TaxID=1816182 RepID=A0A7W9II58_9ACTN|nr:DUF2637 domain-containing protein [Streptosporangium becharense]MBB2912440.1 hypothetical protein [Streptosporangium becharense]MBB5820731.1 hypothetical protein [Streptosporangium becharense]
MTTTAPRLAVRLADSGPVLILAAIAGAGSFTHIRETATEHGQPGWMAWAVAVCVDLTCVMAARERQRDRKNGRRPDGWISWPTLVLVGGIVLSLAANLAQAEPSPWGWITAATPAGAFLIAVSMLERRASEPRTEPSPVPVPVPDAVPETVPAVTVAPEGPAALVPPPGPAVPDRDSAENGQNDSGPVPGALLDYARRVADEHHARHGRPITRDTLRSRLGVSSQLASDLLHALRDSPEPA